MNLRELQALLDGYLEVEYSFRDTLPPARILAALDADRQHYVLNWVRRIASTHIELGYRFACQADQALASLDEHLIEAWVLHAMDCYDRSGLHPALEVIDNLEKFVHHGLQRASGAVLEEKSGVLLPFLHGLSGRALHLEEAAQSYTDTEVVYLPPVVAYLPDPDANFRVYKAMAAHCWAQTRYGTFRVSLDQELASYADWERALRLFHHLETLRLDACIRRDFPGLSREMRWLRDQLGDAQSPESWRAWVRRLESREASVNDSLELLARVYPGPVPDPVCYQGRLDPAAVAQTLGRRLEREKAYLRVALRDLAGDRNGEDGESPARFEVQAAAESTTSDQIVHELYLDDKPIAPPENVRQLMTSIVLDLGGIPPEYLVPAGPGEYDLKRFEPQGLDPDEVWQGAYHEEGAFFYKEWDCQRQHYRKNWCVLREIDVSPANNGFFEQTLTKHGGLIKSLRRTFEALRGEDRLLKRQRFGEDVDIDALVEAWADGHRGMEMTDRLFTRMHREERNIAAALMVDMSGSTKGWVNDAEREALILLSESLAMLGDRFAIYGFSGTTRKRCEVFRVKSFDDPYDDLVKDRISGIHPRDYTRMGVAIRHLTDLLQGVDARTKLLVTLSDGKPEDYDGYYRGEYGIEDTRQALFEARQKSIHPFCITIDEEGEEYLPHMYGAANFVVIKDVARLPLKVSDIYRKITS